MVMAAEAGEQGVDEEGHVAMTRNTTDMERAFFMVLGEKYFTNMYIGSCTVAKRNRDDNNIFFFFFCYKGKKKKLKAPSKWEKISLFFFIFIILHHKVLKNSYDTYFFSFCFLISPFVLLLY